MWRFRGALLTWGAGLGALFLLGSLWMGAALTWFYHPMSPSAFWIGPLVGIAALGLLALIILGVRHASLPRRVTVARNAVEVLAVAGVMALSATVAVMTIRGPETRDVVLFGETYRIPSVYSPYATKDAANRPVEILITVCGPERSPVYGSFSSCGGPQFIRLGAKPMLQEFSAEMLLRDAKATQSNDRLVQHGRFRKDAATDALIFEDGSKEIRLWLDPTGKVEAMRICYRSIALDCEATVRLGDMTLFLPVPRGDASKTKPALLAEAAVWQARFDGWRCPKFGQCPATP